MTDKNDMAAQQMPFRHRPSLLLDVPRVWMEPLERRQCLSVSIDPHTGNPVRSPPTFDQLPAGYFRYLTSADLVPTSTALPYIGDATYTGTVLTLWGKPPRTDRAYIGEVIDYNENCTNWTPAEVVDVPGPTFEVRVSSFDISQGIHATRVALIDDNGLDYFLYGARFVRSSSALVPWANEIRHDVAYWNHTVFDHQLEFYDRDATADSQYSMSIDWHDGSGPQAIPFWDFYPERADRKWVSLRTLETMPDGNLRQFFLDHVVQEGSTATLRVDRTTGTPASFELPVTFYGNSETTWYTPPDLNPPATPAAPSDDPPLIDGKIGWIQMSRHYFQNIDEPVTDLGTFDTPTPLPDGTVADVTWSATQTVTVTPIDLGQAIDDEGRTVHRYRLIVPEHFVDRYSTWSMITLKHGDERAYGETGFFGIPPGLGINWLWDVGTAGIAIAEGSAGPSGTSFTDTDPVADDQYSVRLALDDGRTFIGSVESHAAYNEKLVWFDLPALWSSFGTPFEGFDYGTINEGGVNAFPTGVMTISRPGATLVVPTRFLADTYASQWISAHYLTLEAFGVPPLATGGQEPEAESSPPIEVDRGADDDLNATDPGLYVDAELSGAVRAEARPFELASDNELFASPDDNWDWID